MINHKPLTGIFLGSGASAALAEISTEDKFINKLFDEGRDGWINRGSLKIGGYQLADWIRHVGDIELCMSHLHNLASIHRESGAIVAIINLRAAIAEYLKRLPICPGEIVVSSEKKTQDLFERFLQENMRRSSVVFPTTNYDLVIEQLLKKMGFPSYYPEIPGQVAGNHTEGIPIYKLHGSINWLEKRWVQNGQLMSTDPPTLIVDDPGVLINDSDVYLYSVREQDGTGRKKYSPVLIPFFYQKEVWLESRWRPIFDPHWRSATDLLSKDVAMLNIYSIGYRLPPADHYMLTWLLEILNKAKLREILREVVVVCKLNFQNSSDKELQKALYPFFEDKNVHRDGLAMFLKKYFGEAI